MPYRLSGSLESGHVLTNRSIRLYLSEGLARQVGIVAEENQNSEFITSHAGLGRFVGRMPTMGGETWQVGFDNGGLLRTRTNALRDVRIDIPLPYVERYLGKCEALCASLSVLLLLVDRSWKKSDGTPPIKLATCAAEWNYTIFIEFSPKFWRWLKDGDRSLSSVEEAMARAYSWLHPISMIARPGNSYIEDGQLNLRVGEASVVPNDNSDPKNRRFNTNNCESPAEQLVLIAGLAALTDLACQEGAFS